MRNEPRSAKSTLWPNSRPSRTIAPRLMRALLTSPADSEVSRTIRSTTILFVRCCCETGWAKYTVYPFRLPIGCVFDFTKKSIILFNCFGYQLYNAVLSCLLLTAFNTHIRVMMNTLIRILPVTLIRVLGHTLVWVSSNHLYMVCHSLAVLMLYILLSITVVVRSLRTIFVVLLLFLYHFIYTYNET